MSDLGNKSVFALNLKYYMKKNNIDRNTLCNDLKLKYSTVSEWINAKKYPRIDKIELIANYFNIQKSDLIENKTDTNFKSTDITEQKESSNLGAVIKGKTRMIPLYESVSAGFGAYADDYIIDYIPLIIDCDEEAKNTICIKVIGDSMYPKIEENDIIVVRKQTSVDSGSVGVFIIDHDEALVKKVKYVTGEDWLDLISFNPEYQTKHFEGADVERVQTYGLVRQVIKTL